MATNYSEPSRDYPTLGEVRQMQQEDRYYQQELNREQSNVDKYLKNHPSASYAEATFNINRGKT